MAMITTNDAMVKHLTQVFGIGQIMLLRGLTICCIFVLVLSFKRQPIFNKSSFHRWNLLRGFLELMATLAFLTGLSMLPIATASALAFSSPIILAVIAAVFLNERVGLVRWMVILGGFGGVVLITNPFSETTSWALIFPIACAFFVALRDVTIRFVPDEISSLQIAFTNAWMVTLGGAIYTLLQGWNTADLHWYLWFIGLAGALYCGYLFYIMGTRLGELSFIGPFKYISIIIAIMYGYFIWGETPSTRMLIGAAIIVLSGVVLVYGEKKRASHQEDTQPLV